MCVQVLSTQTLQSWWTGTPVVVFRVTWLVAEFEWVLWSEQPGWQGWLGLFRVCVLFISEPKHSNHCHNRIWAGPTILLLNSNPFYTHFSRVVSCLLVNLYIFFSTIFFMKILRIQNHFIHIFPERYPHFIRNSWIYTHFLRAVIWTEVINFLKLWIIFN